MTSNAIRLIVSGFLLAVVGAACSTQATPAPAPSPAPDGGAADAETADGATECISAQEGKFAPDACQACAERQCCPAMFRCFGIIIAGAPPLPVDCNGQFECLAGCASGPESESAACRAACTSKLMPDMKKAFETLDACMKTSCGAECP